MTLARGAVLAGLALLVAGCSGAKGPAFRPEVVEAGKAVIYVFRPSRSFAGKSVGVSVDQQFIGRLDAGQYVARLVDPGERVVRVDGASDAVRQISLIPGDSAFLEVRSSYWDSRPTIRLLDEATARELIAHTGRAEAPR